MLPSQIPHIEVEGSPLRDELAATLVDCTVDDHLVLPDMFVMTFADDQREMLDAHPFRIGSKVRVRTGSMGEDPSVLLIDGEVTALEAALDERGSFLVVRGYDQSHRLHRARKTASFNQMTDSDLAKQVASAAGVRAGTVDSTSVTHEHISQVNLTDWEFLKARGREIGFEVTVSEGKLHFRAPDDSGPSPSLVMGTDLLEFHPRITAAQQVGKVTVRGWDYVAKDVVSSSSEPSTRSVALKDSSLEGARLAAMFGSPEYVSCDRAVASVAEARAAATALGEEFASGSAEASGTAVGDPKLKAGVGVDIAGVGRTFEGTWRISHSRHVFDETGYHTHFEVSGKAERSLLGLTSNGNGAGAVVSAGGPPIYGVVVGIVTSLKDPEEHGRVRLKFPWLSDDYESGWVRVCHPGAGKDRGFFVMPEIDDEVLVVFEQGDVRRPYVIGSLYNGKDTPPHGSDFLDDGDGSVVWRTLTSRKGHHVAICDKDREQQIVVADKDEKYKIVLKVDDKEIEIDSDGRITITAKDDVKISTTKDLTIEGQNVTIKANASLKMNGNGGAKLDGGAQTEIVGGVIKLN